MSKRGDIVEATKRLLWEHGYQATSPRKIQEVSNAGQGCFYHHFKSKKDLVATALEEVASERIAEFDRVFDEPGPVSKRIERYILQPREPLSGCRIGRMAWDSGVYEVEIQRSLQRFFEHVDTRIRGALEAAAEAGQIRNNIPIESIAALAIAGVQGAFTASRATQDPEWYSRCVTAVATSIRCAIEERPAATC